MTHRPTRLTLYLRTRCPLSVSHYDQTPHPAREIFAVGTAAHEFLEAAALGLDLDDVRRRLLTKGRQHGDIVPPMDPDSVAEGLALARAWIELHGTPQGQPEQRFAVDREWRPVRTINPHHATHIDLFWYEEEDIDEDDVVTVYTTAVARDYKTAWPDRIGGSLKLQQRFQAAIVAACCPSVDAVRVEIGNLRTGEISAYEIPLDEAGRAELAEWRRELDAVMWAFDVDDRQAAPGVGCLACPYAGTCHEAAYVEPDNVVVAYAIAKARADALAKLAREAMKDRAPIERAGVSIGYVSRPTTKLAPGTLRAAVGALVDDLPERVAGALDAVDVKLGTSWAKEVAKVLHGRQGKEAKAAREAWLSEHTIEGAAARWVCAATLKEEA